MYANVTTSGETEAQPAASAHTDDLPLNPVRLAVFRTVVEHRSFTRAADALSLTQSTISSHIRVLERLFGCELFDRRRRGAHLTEAGEAVYDFAIGLERELTALRAHLRDLAEGQAGTVTIGAIGVVASHILPVLLTRFQRGRPAARLRLRQLSPESIGKEILRGGVDIGIVSESQSLPPSLCRVPLWRETFVLVAPPDHPLAQKPQVTLRDLVDQPFVVGWGRTRGEQALNQALARAGLPQRRVVMEVGNLDAVRTAVLEGAGLAVLFRRIVATDLAAGSLVALPIQEVSVEEQYLLVHRPTHRFTPLAQQLIVFLRNESQKLSDNAGISSQ